MNYLLRKISLAKWEPNLDLQPENYSADAITGCTRTFNNTLSVWESATKDFSTREVQKIIVALATTMSAPDTIDLIWLDCEHLVSQGVTIASTPGGSQFLAVNERHKDMLAVDYRQLAIIGQHIIDQFNSDRPSNYIRYSRPQLISLVNAWLQEENTFLIDDLSPKWIVALNKL